MLIGDYRTTFLEALIFFDYNGYREMLQGKRGAVGLAGKLQLAVDEAKEHKEPEVEYMTMQMKLLEEREEVREEGREEGRSEEREFIVKRLLLSGKSPKMIAELCGYDIEEVIAIKKYIHSVHPVFATIELLALR